MTWDDGESLLDWLDEDRAYDEWRDEYVDCHGCGAAFAARDQISECFGCGEKFCRRCACKHGGGSHEQ